MTLREENGVVALEAVVEDELSVHMVMERCDGGDLFDCISACDSLVEDDARRLFRWVGDGLTAELGQRQACFSRILLWWAGAGINAGLRRGQRSAVKVQQCLGFESHCCFFWLLIREREEAL